ncbi:MAG: hipA [Polaromonas sp.]|nr:hipA [Polaromonas sp.]
MAFADLDIWMNGQHVGVWFWSRTGTAGFRYADSWFQSPNARALSVSLPMPAGGGNIMGPKVEHYFDNLLPDSSRIRERLRRRFSTSSTRAADLLAAIGRDCVGALQLMPQGSEPPAYNRIDSMALSEQQVETLLGDITHDGTDESELAADFRISIAGAQEKTALLRVGQQWHLPTGATPTTHIFKLPLGLIGNIRANMSDSIENEWLCATLLAALGFEVAPTEIGQFGKQKVLIVERFDRRWMDGGSWIARLPQEDFCQATGMPGELKYESDGGPGIRASLALLTGGSHARDDSLRFVLAQLAFWLMAATDGHAKNFSIFLERGGGFRMTPLYDVLSIWPIIGNGANLVSPRRAKLAMALRSKNAHYHLHEISTRHWEGLARQSGVPGAFEQMAALVARVPEALAQVEARLPASFPAQVFEAIRSGMRAQAEKFLAELP